jgi:MFS family permease
MDSYFMSADRKEGWGPLSVFYLGNVLFASGLIVHAFSFNFYLRELGYSPVVMGHQVTAMTLGGLLALAPAGYVIDRFGTRTALLGGVIVTTIALAITALVHERYAIHLAAALVGVGGATCRVSWGPAMMRLASESRRARAFTWNVALLIA